MDNYSFKQGDRQGIDSPCPFYLNKRTQECVNQMLKLLTSRQKMFSAELTQYARDLGYGAQATSTARKFLKGSGELIYINQREVASKDYALANGLVVPIRFVFRDNSQRYKQFSQVSKYGLKGCFVYLIKRDNDGIFKIGITGNLTSRAYSIAISCGSHVSLITFFDFVSREEAEQAEATLHTRFIAKRIIGEWFELTDADVTYIISLGGDHND